MPMHPKAQKIASAVLYEWKMFIATIAALNGVHFLGGAIRNALLESLLIHARILTDFFFTDPSREDDVSAKHFFHNEEDWRVDFKTECPYLYENRQRLNKSVAHLSYSRIEYESDKEWQYGRISNELHSIWDKFRSSLPTESREWFPSGKESLGTVV